MKGVNKYMNNYIDMRTNSEFSAKITAKLRKHDYCIKGNIIKFNKDRIYDNIHNKDLLDSIMNDAMQELVDGGFVLSNYIENEML